MISRNAIGISIATAGGAGFSPIAPGTAGTIVAIPLVFLSSALPLWGFAAITAATTVIGIWAAGVADEAWGTHDSGRIVIDEVAGYFVTMLPVSRSDPTALIVGFFVFRALDILKPPPIRAIDRQVGGGAGVVLDDVAAGVMGAGLMAAAAALEWVPFGGWSGTPLGL
jgi:phosphatidylglycerophosphatase A